MTTPATGDLAERRKRLAEAAAELGLVLAEPPPARTPGPVTLRLAASDQQAVERALALLARRGINLRYRSERSTSQGRDEVWAGLYLDDPGNDPGDAPPPGRVLWSEDDPTVAWEATLLRFDDPADPAGHIRRPVRAEARPGSLPVPLLDERGREIGQVLTARVAGGALVVSGLVATSQLHAFMRGVGVTTLLARRRAPSEPAAVRPVWRSSAPEPVVWELQESWTIPAVRLTPDRAADPIRICPPPEEDS